MKLKRTINIYIAFLFVIFSTSGFAQPDNEKDYQDAIASADASFIKKDYINAKASYQYAQKLKPEEKYPKDRLEETIKRLREKMIVMEAYNTEIALADKHFRLRDYALAKEKYKAAAKILPSEDYPSERLNEIEKIETEAKEKQDSYDKDIANAEKLISYKKYDKAIGEYEKAALIFPKETLPKEKIKELEVLRDEANEKDAAYNELIASADRLYNLKYYQNAKEDYEKALKIKPDESFPTERIKTIDEVLVQKNEYDKLVEDADELYISKNLTVAKSKYQESLKIYPGESYPKGMIEKINAALNSEKDIEELYQQSLADANSLFLSKDYTNAINEYENASSIKPDQALPKEKIDEINELLAKLGADDLAYNKAIEKGEQLYGNKDFSSARIEFEKATELKPNEQFPKDRLSEINNAMSANQEIQDSFDQVITKADDFMASEDFDKAVEEYNNALVIIPGQKYASDKISEINVLKAQQLEDTKSYAKLVAEADKLFGKANYTEAREKYIAAKEIDTESSYPAERILAIDKILSDEKSNEESYLTTIQSADDFFIKKDYQNALVEYQSANKLKPDEKYPIEKTEEINGILGGQKMAQDNYNNAIASADIFFDEKDYNAALKKYQSSLSFMPNAEYATTRIMEIQSILATQSEIDVQYSDLISEAGALYKSGDLEGSKAKYTTALSLKLNEPIPSDRIKEINVEITALADKQKSYDEAIAAADTYFEAADYSNASEKYKEASGILPSEQYPKTKLAEVVTITIALSNEKSSYEKAIATGDNLFSKNNYAAAKAEFEKAVKLKPSNSYPSEKINEIELILAKITQQQNSYDQGISLADQMFLEKKYNLSKIEYQKALDLKPEEKYPANKIKEIDDIISNQAFTLNLYNQTITEADQLFDDGKYSKAKLEYEKATLMQSSEQYPKQRIMEIEQLIAQQDAIDLQYNQAISEADNSFKQKLYEQALTHYQDAAELKPEARKPQDRIAEITTVLVATQKKDLDYANAIKEGDGLFALEDYESAKIAFMKAGNIKKSEQYPKDKIEEIGQLILQKKNALASYNRIIAVADRMMNEQEYGKAKVKYEEVQTVLPNEQYPKDKLAEISQILLAAEMEIQNQYNAAITTADNFMDTKEYEQASLKYREALKLKPEEQYSVGKIAEIEHLITDFETLKANYNKLVADADKLFKTKDYSEAKPIYVEAAALMPDESYPATKIKEINLIFKAQQEKIQQDYDKAIADADKFFAAHIFDKAIESYRIARKVKPEEIYPNEMIGKIRKILDENSVRSLLSSIITLEDQSEKKFDFEPVSITDRKKSFIYIKARNTSDVAFKVVMGYGKGGSKNGGIILPIPANQETQEFIISIGSQYKWFNENNNWLSLTPQGGTVEVELVKISRGE